MPSATEFAGRLRQRITIEQPVETPSASGRGDVNTGQWTTVRVVWMEKLDLAGRELVAARQVFAEVPVKFRLRFLAGLTPKMRLRADTGTVYDISAISDPDGMRRQLEILAVVRGA